MTGWSDSHSVRQRKKIEGETPVCVPVIISYSKISASNIEYYTPGAHEGHFINHGIIIGHIMNTTKWGSTLVLFTFTPWGAHCSYSQWAPSNH